MQYFGGLMTTEKDWTSFLEEKHMIKTDVWKKHGLNFDTRFLYIPYKNKAGRLLFNKKRKAPNYDGANKYLYGEGTSAQLWPYFDFSSSDTWILTEGELDQLTLESVGFAAVTTGSATSFKYFFADNFKDKKVYICYDNDKSGKQGAERVAKFFAERNVPAGVYIIDLPEMKDGKDIGDFFKLGHTKEEFEELIKNARKPVIQDNNNSPSGTETRQRFIERPLTYEEVENKVSAFLPSSTTGLKIVLAVVISCVFQNPVMLWLLFVGVPSSGKTELVRLTRKSGITYYLDNLTQNAFISGERATKSQKVHDLLPELDKMCLVIKDWTSIFSLDEKMTKKLLGDLVGIYDKEFIKFSSRRGIVGYASAFSQLGCITPATLNKHTQYMNMVGPRFLCYTMPVITQEERDRSFELIFSNTDRSLLEKEANLYVASYIRQLAEKTLQIKPLSKDVQVYLRTAADLMSNCRGIVILQSSSFKNDDGDNVTYYDVLEVQIEDPWRAVQQLKSLAIYLAFIVGKDEVGVEELAIIKEIVISSMPADRSQALRAIKEQSGTITAKTLADLSEKSNRTSRRLLDELSALRVLEKIKGSGTIATDYQINFSFKNFLLLDPAEFLSNNVSGTETRDGIETELQDDLFKSINKKKEVS